MIPEGNSVGRDQVLGSWACGGCCGWSGCGGGDRGSSAGSATPSRYGLPGANWCICPGNGDRAIFVSTLTYNARELAKTAALLRFNVEREVSNHLCKFPFLSWVGCPARICAPAHQKSTPQKSSLTLVAFSDYLSPESSNGCSLS